MNGWPSTHSWFGSCIIDHEIQCCSMPGILLRVMKTNFMLQPNWPDSSYLHWANKFHDNARKQKRVETEEFVHSQTQRSYTYNTCSLKKKRILLYYKVEKHLYLVANSKMEVVEWKSMLCHTILEGLLIRKRNHSFKNLLFP